MKTLSPQGKVVKDFPVAKGAPTAQNAVAGVETGGWRSSHPTLCSKTLNGVAHWAKAISPGKQLPLLVCQITDILLFAF